MSVSQKPNYGLDAPPVVRNLAVAGMTCVILGLILYFLLAPKHQELAFALLLILLFSSFCLLLTTAAMVWSSKRGKLIARERMINSLHLSGKETVLDVGCGRGLLLNCVGKRLTQGKAIGLDLWQSQDQSGNSPEITFSNSRLEGVEDRIEILSGDMREIPLKDKSIDVALSSIAIHNIEDRAGRQKAITEINRVLKPGGRVLLADFQNVEEYASALRALGWNRVEISRRNYLFFPPVRLLKGQKPQ